MSRVEFAAGIAALGHVGVFELVADDLQTIDAAKPDFLQKMLRFFRCLAVRLAAVADVDGVSFYEGVCVPVLV